MDKSIEEQQKDFREKLVKAVRATGQDISDNAESFVGDTCFLSNMTITISFDPEYGMLYPTINIGKDYLSKRAIDILRQEEKGEKL